MRTNLASTLFDPAHSHWQPGALPGTYLGRVVSVQDELNQAQVQVRLLNCDGVPDQDAPIWARVAVPFAGPGRGAFFIPDVDDEVLVTFVNGDPRFPIVVGGLWHGNAAPPEELSGDRVDRWSFVGKHGARVAIVEESQGQSTVEISTPGEVNAKWEEAAGGKITVEAAGSTITIDNSGVSINTQRTVSIQASRVTISAGQVSVDTALATFSGTIQCNILQASAVNSASYSPGAGNMW